MTLSKGVLGNFQLSLPKQFGGGGGVIAKTVRHLRDWSVFCRFEQEYLNDMMKKYDKSLQRYFWTGLRDANARGEYSWAVTGGLKQAMTFSNWNFLEPGERLIKG